MFNINMKIYTLSFLISLITTNASAQHEGHTHDLPVNASTPIAAAVDTSLKMIEDVYDFGKIPQGKPVHHVFAFKNTGSSSLKLVNVQASCGCTTPEWDKENETPAGNSGSIKVGYNAAAEGPFNKNITITYNDNQIKIISIKGEVWKTPASSAPSNAASNDLKER
jgi:hypothetical protein